MTQLWALRRPLQTRLALVYAAGIFIAGIVVLALVDIPLAGIQSTKRRSHSASTAITSSGNGISPHQLLTGSVVALAVLIPVALVLGWFVAYRYLRPLQAMTATVGQISAGNLRQRLDLGEPTEELTLLGQTLDHLFARLEASFDAQRNFVANVSHELRTPLAGLRTLLEVALDDPLADSETLRSACQEALTLGAHQERLVTGLLVLATSERGVARSEATDLAQVVRDVLASRRDPAAKQDLSLTEWLAPAVTIGDPRLIESLVANLIDNAIRHNHPEGHIRIVTESSKPCVSLTVMNSGPVIPEDQVQRLLQPFQRLVPGRNGHHDGYGLGLAIANAVVQAHHATLTIEAPPGGGLAVTVQFTQRG